MVQVMMVNFILEKNKDKDDLSLVMDQYMKENFLIIWCMVNYNYII